jgi:aspartyl-tRNA(Asn)/glutamyl-tRNA(Gln) amidotransferase subunit B
MEPNISVRPVGSDELRTRTEVKNLNSIRNMSRASAIEIERQIEVWESGGQVVQETRGWDEQRQTTVSQRSKESAHDYRYFPEPDLPTLEISKAWVDEIRTRMPELPDSKRQRYINDLGLNDYDAGVIIADRVIGDYFEAATEAGGNPKTVANWIIGEIFRLMNKDSINREKINEILIKPKGLVKLISLVDKNTINNNTAKQVLDIMYADGGDPSEIVKAHGLAQESDEAVLREAVTSVVNDHPDELQRWREGEEKVTKFLMGQVMRAMQGKANAQLVQQFLNEELSKHHE